MEDADIVSVDDDDDGISDPFPTMGAVGGPVPDFLLSSGDDIADAEIVGDEREDTPVPRSGVSSRSRIKQSGVRDSKGKDTPRDATTKPPSLDEWSSFFSKIVLRLATDWYLAYAFHGVDEDMLSEREVERLALTDDERKTIAVPFAELSNKSKFMRKHGRMIVSSGDAFNAFVVMGAWVSRVNRIASKYKPRNTTVKVNGVAYNGSSGQGTEESESPFPTGAHGGHFPPGWSGGVVRGSG